MSEAKPKKDKVQGDTSDKHKKGGGKILKNIVTSGKDIIFTMKEGVGFVKHEAATQKEKLVNIVQMTGEGAAAVREKRDTLKEKRQGAFGKFKRRYRDRTNTFLKTASRSEIKAIYMSRYIQPDQFPEGDHELK